MMEKVKECESCPANDGRGVSTPPSFTSSVTSKPQPEHRPLIRSSHSIASSSKRKQTDSGPPRNKAFDVHPGTNHAKGGNAYFVKLIENHMDDFEVAKKETKRRRTIVDSIIDDIHQHGGCFLSEKPTIHSYRSIRKRNGQDKNISVNNEEIECRYGIKDDTQNYENDSVILSRQATSKKVRDFFYRFLKKRRQSQQSQLEDEKCQEENLSPLRKKPSVADKVDPVTQKRPAVPMYRAGSRRSCRSKIHQRTTLTNAQHRFPAGEEATTESQNRGTLSHGQESPLSRVPYSSMVNSFPQENLAVKVIKTTSINAAVGAVVPSKKGATLEGAHFDPNAPVDLYDGVHETTWNPTPPHPPQRWVSCSAEGMKWFGFECETDMSVDSPSETITGQIKSCDDCARDVCGDDYEFSGSMTISDNSSRRCVSARSFGGSHIGSHHIDDEKASVVFKRMPAPMKNASAESLPQSNPGTTRTTPPAAPCLRSCILSNRKCNDQSSVGQVNNMGLPHGGLMSPDSPGLMSLDIASCIGSEADTVQEAMNLAFLTESPGFSPIGWKIPTTAGGMINIACCGENMQVSRSPTLGNFLSPPRASKSSAAFETVHTGAGKDHEHHLSQAGSSQVWRLSPQLLWCQENAHSGSAGINVGVNHPMETRLTSTERASLWADSSCVKNLTSRFHSQFGETSLSGSAPSPVEPQHWNKYCFQSD